MCILYSYAYTYKYLKIHFIYIYILCSDYYAKFGRNNMGCKSKVKR